MSDTMKLHLRVWRQLGPDAKGKLVDYTVDAHRDMSFLEMLDVLNEDLIRKGEEAIEFDNDCREGYQRRQRS
jgi:succinate dehydrogenase / fumarate reductase iron-sulfur subunit